MAAVVNISYNVASGRGVYAGVSGPPAWRDGQAINSWREITGSAMADSPPSVNPGRASGVIGAIIDAWNNLSIDTRSSRVWSLYNGGHDDTHENGARYLDLALDSPVWVEVLASNAAADFTIPCNAAYYSNGRPVSRHSYYGQQFIESRNRAMCFGVGAGSTAGNAFLKVEGYDCNATGTSGIDPPGTYPDLPSFGTDMACCKNPTTGDVYVFAYNNAVYKWTNATNTWSSAHVGFPPDTQYASAAYDTSRNVIFLTNAVGAWTFNPATGAFTSRTLTGSYTAQVGTIQGALAYVPETDKFYMRVKSGNAAEGGANIYVIDPSTWATSLLGTTGGTGIPVGFGTLGGGAPYGRLLYVPVYSGLVWIPRYSSNAWFLRTH